jgi:hypothetical protein
MTTQEHAFTLDGFLLGGVDGSGVEWTVRSFDGWLDAPPMRTNRQPRAQQAGSWPATGHAAERLVEFTGLAICPDTHAMEDAARRLNAVLARGQVGPLSGSSRYGTLSTQVAVEEAPIFRTLSDRIGSYTVTVAASDPLLYGPPTFATASLASSTPGAGRQWPRVWPTDWGVPPGVTPGAVTIPNAGTAAYWPRLRIDGPVLNPVVTLVETGAWVRYSGDLLAGQWLDMDMASRRVLLQGQVSVRERVTSSGNWLAIPVSGGSIAWTADTADPAAVLSVWGYERAVS